MGARRDSNDSHSYCPPVDFWFIPVFCVLHPTSFKELYYLSFNNHGRRANPGRYHTNLVMLQS